jgi:GNAT superfamily N-acetyltransferase
MNNHWKRGEYEISTDRSRLDVDLVFAYLSNHSYWARGRKREVVIRSIDNSLNFGIFTQEKQVGFARVVTDKATFAWLADVFVIEEHRNQGLGKWLVEVITSHAELQGLRRWLLATRDAHELYRQFGFRELDEPMRWMEIYDPSTESLR